MRIMRRHSRVKDYRLLRTNGVSEAVTQVGGQLDLAVVPPVPPGSRFPSSVRKEEIMITMEGCACGWVFRLLSNPSSYVAYFWSQNLQDGLVDRPIEQSPLHLAEGHSTLIVA